MAMHVYKKGIFRYRRLNKLTLFPFKSTYLAKVEVYTYESGVDEFCLCSTSANLKQAKKDFSLQWLIQELARWQSLSCRLTKFLPNKWQTEFLQSREPRQKCDVSQLWWHKMMLRFIPYLVNMDLSVAAFLLPTSQTSSIICYVTFLHITDRSAVLIMYHTSTPVLKVREKNQSLGCM